MAGVHGGRSRVIAIGTAALVVVALMALRPTETLAQAGNVGGTIGNRDKSISGEKPATPRRAAPATRKATAAAKDEVKSKGKRCPSIAGAWNSWAAGLFGKGDAVFGKDGSATHRSGITGTWRCENGQLHITWSDGKPGLVHLSPDGKKITNAAGGVHASRD